MSTRPKERRLIPLAVFIVGTSVVCLALSQIAKLIAGRSP